jgi:hypothetical protein
MPRLLPLALVMLVACGPSTTGSAPAATDVCGEVEQVPVQAGAHLLPGSAPPVPYSSTPPTSGWHSSGVLPIGVYAPAEALSEPDQVATLEAGGAVVTYDYEGLPADQRGALEEVVTRDFPRRVAVTPYDRLGEGEVVFTAWGVLQRCQGLDVDALTAFVEAYADPEPAAPGDEH